MVKQNNMKKLYKNVLPELQLKYIKGDFKKFKVESSKDVFNIVKEMYDQDTIEYNESIIVIYFDAGNESIGWTRHTSGGTACCIVDNKMIMSEALLCGAASFIISHNHPSGTLIPSTQDNNITTRLKQAAEVMGLSFLDHIIIAGDKSSYFSYAEEGIL